MTGLGLALALAFPLPLPLALAPNELGVAASVHVAVNKFSGLPTRMCRL